MLHRIGHSAFLKVLERAERAFLIAGVAATLSERKGRIVSRRELIEGVWGNSCEPDNFINCLDVAIYRLRKSGFQITSHKTRGYSHAA